MTLGPDPLELLVPRLPPGAVPHVAGILARLPCDVRVSRPRRTKLGDHRAPTAVHPRHRITINENLNPFAFLTTLIHELAHADTWERYERPRRRRLRPHGREWKVTFAELLVPVVADGDLPDDVVRALERSIRDPAAASCSDRGLALVLARYDAVVDGRVRVEELAEGTIFRTDTGHVLCAGALVRTRRRCFEPRTGREWRVHGLATVEILEPVSGSWAAREPGPTAGPPPRRGSGYRRRPRPSVRRR